MAAVTEEPKKAMTSYFIYLTEMRPELMKALGDNKSRGGVASFGSKRWNALSEEQKAPYIAKAAASKEQYQKDLAAFLEAGGEVAKKGKEKVDAKKKRGDKAAKKEADKDKPKSPAGGAFGCYMAEHRQSIMKNLPGSACTKVMKVGSEQWKTLSDAAKIPYQTKYEEKAAKYKVDLEAWKATNAEAGGDMDKDNGEEEDVAEAAEEPTPKKSRVAVSVSAGDVAVFDEAKKLGYAAKLKALLQQRSDVPAAKALAALKDAKGSTVAAKKALAAGA